MTKSQVCTNGWMFIFKTRARNEAISFHKNVNDHLAKFEK